MKNTVFGVLALLHMAFMPCYAAKVSYNQSKNEIEILHEFEVKGQSLRNDEGLLHNTCVFVPPAPADKVTFIMSAPRTVYVGQQFTIYFSIHPDSKVSIPFWADLIPDASQASAQGLKYISHSAPTMGGFNDNAQSVAFKGSKGRWNINEILHARQIPHMSITLEATTPGRKRYSTLIATNPPSVVSMTIDCTQVMPIAMPDYARGLQNKPLTISVLDNDYGMSALQVISVTDPAHGAVTIDNNALRYMPENDFVGDDHFSYKIQDAVGNCAQADVMVTIAECPAPVIIR